MLELFKQPKQWQLNSKSDSMLTYYQTEESLDLVENLREHLRKELQYWICCKEVCWHGVIFGKICAKGSQEK